MNLPLALLITFLCGCFGLPPHQRRFSDQEFNDIVEHENEKPNNNSTAALDELGIEYTRYLQEVIDTLEKDESFKKKLESAAESDIKTAKIAEELDYVNHHVRSKLDELKRTELKRLRELAKQAYDNEHDFHLNPPGHLDHENPDTFEIKDLKKLIHQVAQDLEETDKKRKQMFKQYEMQKHFEREASLVNMTEEEKKKYLHEEEEAKKKEEEAKKRVHRPGSRQQLEEVWEEQDHMSKNDFNPRTFFVMHDVDGNGFLDEEEVKSLFLKELDKLYAQGMPQADLMERAEEMERMREHVFNEVDKNRDRLISWEEFYAMSQKPEFNEDPGWKPIDDQQIYTQDEWLAFERQRLAEIEQLKKEGKLPQDYRVPTLHEQMNYPYQAGIDPNAHYAPAYPPQAPGQPLHSPDAIHAQQQQYQQFQQHQQFQQPAQYQQQPQFHPQQHQQFQQQPHQQFQQQQFHQPQFQSPQAVQSHPGAMPQANLVHPQTGAVPQNPQQVYQQPYVQPSVAQQQPNVVQQSIHNIPQQAVPASSVLSQNAHQQPPVAQQMNSAQQPVVAGQTNFHPPAGSYQAAPQAQSHSQNVGQSHEGQAVPVVGNDQIRTNQV
ncbi:hypothetical protein V9T40_008103 [Parthenolecanium corni]|uniref:EF-hand domain-containing protein n=1 Tax=Parthenolecanium corni TaxID=536013 RepID=A0AAN9TNR3_9HEMI